MIHERDSDVAWPTEKSCKVALQFRRNLRVALGKGQLLIRISLLRDLPLSSSSQCSTVFAPQAATC